MSAVEKTLYETLGGEETISKVVDVFYSKYVLNDERIKHFFVGVDMEKQRVMQSKFLSFAFGGPAFNGKKMNIAHRHLKLTDDHFDAVMDDLGKALRDFDVPEEIIAKVAAVAETTRNDVLGR
ncbi:bacterial-like globin, partial [Basidiobolus meristosporus CBS 931.73]